MIKSSLEYSPLIDDGDSTAQDEAEEDTRENSSVPYRLLCYIFVITVLVFFAAHFITNRSLHTYLTQDKTGSRTTVNPEKLLDEEVESPTRDCKKMSDFNEAAKCKY